MDESETTTAEEVPVMGAAPAWAPLYDKILVKRDPRRQEIGGMAIPETHQKDQNTGVVVAVGGGRWLDGVLYPLTVRLGMTVLFSKFAGVEIEGEEPDLLVMREDELLAYKID